jgi:hypothetical protein
MLYLTGQQTNPEMDMPNLKIIARESCRCELPAENQIGWEAAAYVALEAMQDERLRTRRAARAGACVRSRR